MPTIVQRGDRWLVRWREIDAQGIERERTRSFRRKADAVRRLREVEEDLAAGSYWRPRVTRGAPLLEAAMSAFVVDRARTLAPQTLIRYARALELLKRFLGEAVASAPVSALSRSMLADFFAWLREPATGLHGKQRTVDTARKNVEVVQLFWSWVEDHDDFSAHVTRARTLDMPRTRAPHAVAPTWQEMAACIDACRGWHRQLATVLYATGLRANQAMRLLWSDVDLAAKLLTVRPELGKSDSEKRGRVVPIPSWFAAELGGWGARDGYLIASRRNGVRERQARDRDMGRAWGRAGVRPAAWEGRPHHAFRKGYVSGLKRLGADSEAVEHLVGHSAGLRGVYLDPTALPLLEAVALVPAPTAVSGTVVQLRAAGTEP